MTIERMVNLLVTITLIEMMVSVGLGVRVTDLVGVAKNVPLVLRAVLANYIVVPAVTAALLLMFHSPPMVAAGFLILAACPGAPFGPPCTTIAKGHLPTSVGLMVLLAASSALVAPLLLMFLLPVMSGDEPLHIDAVKLVGTLLVTQLIPLCVGLAVRHRRPSLATRLQNPANRLSAILNIAVVVLILATQFGTLASISMRAYAGMFALLAISLAAGWLLGGPGAESRKAVSLTTSLRNVGVGLVIATGSFPGTPAVTATLAYGLLEIGGSLLLAFWWGHAALRGPLGANGQNSFVSAALNGTPR
jgi:BASS family bile acid:Na+ symporter